MGFSSVVFDLDGTLVDASPDIAAALNTAFAPLGVRKLSTDEVRGFLGRGPRILVELSLGAVECELDDEGINDAFERYSAAYRLHPVRETTLLGDAQEALGALHAAGATLAVCTNKRTDVATQVLDALNVGHFFGVVVGNDAVSNPKPHPDHLLSTLAKIKCDPSDAIYVGDTLIDANTAEAAHVTYVHVPWAEEAIVGNLAISQLNDLVRFVRTP